MNHSKSLLSKYFSLLETESQSVQARHESESVEDSELSWVSRWTSQFSSGDRTGQLMQHHQK